MRQTMVIVVAGLLLGACAESADNDAQEDDGEAEPYVEAMAASMMEEEDGPPLDETQANCFATGIVELVGVDALREAGVSPDEFAEAESFEDLDVDLPDDASAVVADALVECELVESLEGAITDTFDDELGFALSPEAAACLTDRLDDQAVAEAFAATFIDGSGEQIQSLLGSSVGACPDIASEILLSELPSGMTPEAEACVRAFVEDNAEAVGEAFTSGEDSTETQRLGAELAVACPDAFAG
jgi:hypothetical protein